MLKNEVGLKEMTYENEQIKLFKKR